MLDQTKPLWQARACDVAAAVGAGELSCTDAVGAAVDRMRAVNGELNAVVDDLGEQALADAAAADKALADGAAPGPLQGVPVTIKVNIDQTGRATTNGVTAFKDVIAPGDAPVVSNLKKAGAIVIGRTNTPEFSFRATTSNEVHGRTKSPWNDWVTSGGSSGGASSAVISGMGAIGHGNDIGGSLRFPAWATGAATVKPGLGRVPAYNPSAPAERGLLAQLMSVQGAICRNVADVRLAMQSLIQPDPRDPWQAPVPWEGAPLPKKVAFSKNMFEFDLSPHVSAALDTAASALSDAGYEVVEAEPPELREVAWEAKKCLFGETLGLMGGDIEKYGSDTIKAIFGEYAKMFTPYEGKDLQLGMARRSAHVRKWMLFLAEYPLILTPFMPTLPFKWDRDTEGAEGVEEVLGAAIWSSAMNFLGLPAGNVSAGFAEGLPIGVQIVGQRFREDFILDACEVVEAHVGVMAERLWANG
ncbi:MAG: amidase family protein [Pseudomonadota bacterium]